MSRWMTWSAFLLALVLVIPAAGRAQEAAPDSTQGGQEEEFSSCVSCHELQDGELYAPVETWQTDVHHENGIGCDDCHGGDPTLEDPLEAMDPAKGFVGVPDDLEIPHFCARCHADAEYMIGFNPALPVDQLEKYRTSVHGTRNAQGDRKVAQCVDCHRAHDIRPPDDPLSSVHAVNVPRTCAHCHSDPGYMAGYDIPTDQFNKYAQSVHGEALLQDKDTGAPACNDCHGNHGAIPPGVTSIAFVCGNCHVNNMDLFNQSPMKEAFVDLHLPGCETCHGNHEIERTSDQFVGIGPQSVCLNCHSQETRPRGYEVATKISDALSSLTTVRARADSVVHVAAQKGMEVVQAEYDLKDARQALIEARTLVHSFDPDRVGKKAEEGAKSARSALERGKEAIEEYYFRRKGWGVSTLLISFLVVLLVVKIRQVDRSSGS
jgi:hypothetical protein